MKHTHAPSHSLTNQRHCNAMAPALWSRQTVASATDLALHVPATATAISATRHGNSPHQARQKPRHTPENYIEFTYVFNWSRSHMDAGSTTLRQLPCGVGGRVVGPRTRSPWFRHALLADARRSAQPTSTPTSRLSRGARNERPESKPPHTRKAHPTTSPRTSLPWFRHALLADARRSAQPAWG